tara:strand:- start:632 stop:1330 length:699 start_codon:yes stop_codon:yes gene_type:complete
MIDKKISVSEQVSNLHIEAQLIFTWAVPHADDLGLLPIQHKTLKVLIVPLLDINLETFGNHLEAIVSVGLWEVWKHEEQEFYRIVKFLENQTLKKDRKPNTLAKNIDDWNTVDSIWNTMETQVKGSKEKISKVKIINKMSAKADGIKEVFNLFYETINPTINFGNKTNRKSAEDLIKAFGLEETIKRTQYAIMIQGKKFAPVITTPYQLKEKMAQLAIYKKQEDTPCVANLD